LSESANKRNIVFAIENEGKSKAPNEDERFVDKLSPYLIF